MNKKCVSAGILGMGAYLPDKIVKNDFWDGKKFVDIPEGKDPFKGIKERRMFPEGTIPSDIESEAGRRAMEDAGVSPEDIDLVLVQSMIQDEILPGNACIVQHKLGLKNAGAWTIDTCCSSFVTMVVTASNLIATGEFKKILIISSALLSPMADYSQYLCTVIGDAAGAVVMGEVSEDRGYIASACNAHGQYHKGFTLQMRQPLDYKRSHFTPSMEKAYLTFGYDVMKDIGRNSVEDMKHILEKVLNKAEMKGEDIDLFLSHQPVYWAHGAWRDSVGIGSDKSYQTFEKYGNIASSVIPVNLFEAHRLGMLKDGSNLLIASSGAGENHIAAIIKWGK